MRLGVLLLIVSATYCFIKTPICPKYECYNKFESADTCALKTFDSGISIVKLKKCNDSAICDIRGIQDQEDSCSLSYSTAMSYPGDFCRASRECFSGNCTNQICIGALINAKCDSDVDCNPGLYCNKVGKCQRAKYYKEACDSNSRCVANSICDGLSCVLIASKEEGSKAKFPGECRTLFISNGTCKKGSSLVNKDGLKKCPADGVCKYKSDELTYEENCTCGMTKDGASFCNPGRADVDIGRVT